MKVQRLAKAAMGIVVALVILCGAGRPAGATEYTGTLNTDTTWTPADAPVITGDLTVAAGITLTVEAGTQVLFRGAYKLQVNGNLVVNGTAASKVAFKPENPGAGSGAWTGIVVASGATLSMQHTQIVDAVVGLENQATGASLTAVEITGCQSRAIYGRGGSLAGDALVIHGNGSGSSSYAVYVGTGAEVTLTNALVYGNTGYGVYEYYGTLSLVNCTVHGNGNQGVYAYFGVATVKNCIVTQNGSEGIRVYNAVYTASYNNVWGNSSNSNAGSNSISANPLYVDAANEDFRLTHRSPSRKLGEGGTHQGALAFDGAQTVGNLGYVWEDLTIGPGDFVVEGDFTVAPGVTLTVNPGTNLLFSSTDGMVSNDALTELRVEGTLVADGTASQKIVFGSEGGVFGGWYGIEVLSGASASIDNAVVRDAVVGVENRATGTLVTQTEITSCQSRAIYGRGGSLAGDALVIHGNGSGSSSYAVYVGNGAEATLTNALVYGNAGYGVYEYYGTLSLVNCTVHGNGSQGVNAYYGTATVKNCIVTQNGAEGIRVYNAVYTASYNNVWGNSSNSNGGSNSISANPLYVDAANGDFRLTHRSPSRKLGEGGTHQGALAFDGAQTVGNLGYVWEDLTIGPGDFVVEGDFTVAPGVTLTVNPGTNLLFSATDGMVSNDALTELRVEGTLVADGTASQKIVFGSEGGVFGGWYGIEVLSGASASIDNAVIRDAKFGVDNSATGTLVTQTEIRSCESRGIYGRGGSLSGDALVIHGNGSGSSGYGVYVGTGAEVTLTNALVYGNTGYGVYEYYGTLSLVNCTVHGNGNQGVYAYFGVATVKNCIVTQNGSEGIRVYNAVYTASYNNVWGNSSNSNAGSNSISQDPMYVNAAAYNFHLQPNSPCIDTGTGSGAPDHDIENQPRPIQGQNPGSPQWDMGAYEFNPNANRYPVADAGPDRTVIKDEPASFSGSGSYDPDGTIVSYLWDFGDGNTGSGQSTTHTYTTAGTYTVTLTVTDDGGLTGVDQATIHVNTRPVAEAGPDKVAEINETVYFDGSASSDVDGTVVSWSWDFGDGQSAEGVQVNHRYSSAGDYTVTLTVTDDDGATGQDTVLVRVLNASDTTGPVIGHTPLGEQPAGQDVTVVASISDESGIDSAVLYYRVTGAGSFNQATMANTSGNQYVGTIPGASVTTVGVDYYIWARDASQNQNVSTLPATAPASFFSFTVTELDNQPPSIAHTPIADGQPESQAVTVQATVTDPSGVDYVRLYYKGGQAVMFTAADMTNTAGDTWEAQIPASSVAWPRVEYYIEAADSASQPNTGTLPAGAPATVFSFTVSRDITANPGDVIITEIMADTSLQEPASEWFEIYNTTGSDIDLAGWEVRDDDGDSFVIGGASPVVIPSQGYLVLGRSSDPQANGSVPVDYVYGGMLLANSADEIELVAGSTVVDRVAYDRNAGWPLAAGHSMSLDPDHFDASSNDDPANWCQASGTWAGGDFGSPGEQNPVCQPPEDTEGPSISHSQVPDGQPAGQDVNIQAVVADSSGVASVVCYYRSQGASAWTQAPLANVSGDLYQASIPGAAVVEPAVEYYLEAVDSSANQNVSVLPAGGEASPFVFTVVAESEDHEGPAMSHQPVAGPVEQGTAVPISALVTDRSGVAEVRLYFRTAGESSYQSIQLAEGGAGLYSGEIPPAAVRLPGVEYYLEAVDASAFSNVSTLPADYETMPFSFDVIDSSDQDGPDISHTPPDGPIVEGTAVELRATVTDPSGVEDVTVWIYDGNQADFWPLRATETVNQGEYTATVPASAVRVPELMYYIEAVDFSPNQNVSRLPANAPSGTFSVTVEENPSIDRDPPDISQVTADPDPATAGQAVGISATITDASAIAQARLFFRMRGETAFLSVDMQAQSNDLYRAEVPAAVVEEGVLEYYIEARDASPLENTARSPADAPNSLHMLTVEGEEVPPASGGGCGCGSGAGGVGLLPLVVLLLRRRVRK